MVGCLGLIKIAIDHEAIISYKHDMVYATGSTVAWPPLWFLPYLFLVFVVTWLSVKLLTNQRGVNYRQGLVLVCVLFLIGFILLKFQATLSNGVAGGALVTIESQSFHGVLIWYLLARHILPWGM